MAVPNPNPNSNQDLFNSYFNRADLDRDGRISGNEAVAFFQGFNLPQQVLAQIWTYANQNQTEYLGRPEFFNALRLVTVAQSGRELTPDIVKAALGPAAAKIPAPQINPTSGPSAHMNSIPTTTTQSNSMPQPSTLLGSMRPSAFQNLGFKGQERLPNTGTNPQFPPSPKNHLMGPPQGTPASVSFSVPGVGKGPPRGGNVTTPRLPGSNTPILSADWLGVRNSGTAAGPTSQFSIRGISPASLDGSVLSPLEMAPGVTTKPQTPAPSSLIQPKSMEQVLLSSQPAQPAANNLRSLVPSGHGFPSDSTFGGNISSVASKADQKAQTPSFSSSSLPNSAIIAAVSQNPTRLGQADQLQNMLALPRGDSQLQPPPPVKQNQLDTVQRTFALATSNGSVGPVTPSNDSQIPWPKITQSDIQRYTKVFVEVDKDRDGKITGEEARILFLSWRLPREVLKQVWDLSDQDNDSMLSLREFCTALYLMERYREGHPLPTVLPNSLRFDESFLLSTGQPSSVYSGSAWKQNPGLTHQGAPGPRPVMPPSAMKPPRAPLPSLLEEPVQPQQQKAKVPVLEKYLVNQLSEEEQKAINSKFQEATDADKKVQELEKEILDNKEKSEFYRTKMQELVLYKSRCDNKLNEIMEKVSADKREVESLARKYEDKYKEVGDVASKLTLDEATFRDIQERKLELYNAIVKMEQGGTADGVLQDRVNRIQSDLEDLVKALNERCKQYGLRAKPASLVELPFGWQSGMQEGAADWDEDWDKFKDEGFAIIKELTIEVENIVAKPKPPPVLSDKPSASEVSKISSPANNENDSEVGKYEGSTVSSSSSDENKTETENPSVTGGHAAEEELAYAHSETGSTKSPHVSPRGNIFESSSPEFQSKKFNMHDFSPRAKGSYGDLGGTEFGDKFSDEPSWGAKFDNDDADSIWGFSAINTKENDRDRGQHDSFFGAGDFGPNPIRTESPSAESVHGTEKKRPFFDSVPSTPQYTATFSPRFSEGRDDHASDRFGRFDSFSMSGTGLFPPRDSFSRFDSMHGTDDLPSLSRFDSMRSTTDAPPLGSLSRFDSMQSRADHPPLGSLARFDSIRSTSEYGEGFVSFDDADPFGSTGPFKSSESHTPRQNSDNWNAF